MKRTEKTFDCIAFKREAQMAIYEEIKNMSHDEELNYFRSHAEKGLFRSSRGMMGWKRADKGSTAAPDVFRQSEM